MKLNYLQIESSILCLYHGCGLIIDIIVCKDQKEKIFIISIKICKQLSENHDYYLGLLLLSYYFQSNYTILF